MPGRRLHDVVIADLGIKHRKAVVMLGGDDDVSHAGFFGEFDPGIGIELHRIEMAGDIFAIILDWNLQDGRLNVLGIPAALSALVNIPQPRINAPMNEHAKASLAPRGKPLISLCLHRIPPPLHVGESLSICPEGVEVTAANRLAPINTIPTAAVSQFIFIQHPSVGSPAKEQRTGEAQAARRKTRRRTSKRISSRVLLCVLRAFAVAFL